LRQLVRVVVAAAALLAVLGRPAPAAAETADQCLASMNQYRTAAGLNRASATSIPALGKAAAAHAGYRVKVDTATVDYLAVLGLPDLGLFGPDQTTHLESPKLKSLGFTGVNPWDRTRAAKLADGTWRYQYEDVTTATGISAADLKGVRSWIDAPYHRLPLLDANTRHIGCAVGQQGSYSAQVLEMVATWKDTTKRITVYPAPGPRPEGRPHRLQPLPGAPDPVRRRLRPGQPHPAGRLRGHRPGRRVLRHEGPGHRLLQGLGRAPVAIHRAVRYRTTKSTVPSSAVDTSLPANAAMLAATSPLAAATTYNVRISGYVQAAKGGKWVQFKTRVRVRPAVAWAAPSGLRRTRQRTVRRRNASSLLAAVLTPTGIR